MRVRVIESERAGDVREVEVVEPHRHHLIRSPLLLMRIFYSSQSVT